jgi:transcription elongation factor GreB
MSRAFVKEQDDLGPGAPPELTISPHPNWVTAEGLAQIEARLTEIERELSADPGEMEAARLRRDQRYWSARRATARLAPQPDPGSDEVAFGSRVTLHRPDHDEEVLRIVGEDEADPAHGKIGYAAPLAHALLGAAAGDIVRLGDREIEILDVDNSGA